MTGEESLSIRIVLCIVCIVILGEIPVIALFYRTKGTELSGKLFVIVITNSVVVNKDCIAVLCILVYTLKRGSLCGKRSVCAVNNGTYGNTTLCALCGNTENCVRNESLYVVTIKLLTILRPGCKAGGQALKSCRLKIAVCIGCENTCYALSIHRYLNSLTVLKKTADNRKLAAEENSHTILINYRGILYVCLEHNTGFTKYKGDMAGCGCAACALSLNCKCTLGYRLNKICCESKCCADHNIILGHCEAVSIDCLTVYGNANKLEILLSFSSNGDGFSCLSRSNIALDASMLNIFVYCNAVTLRLIVRLIIRLLIIGLEQTTAYHCYKAQTKCDCKE